MRFIRQDTSRLLRLGKLRRKLRKWRRPRGKHNKVRLKRAGYPVQPGIGYRSPSIVHGRVSGLLPALVHNVSQLEKLGKENIAVIARVGAKKKLDILKKAQELGVKIANHGGKK